MTLYKLELRSTQSWDDVRYRAYTTSDFKAETFMKIPKINFTDNGHGIVPSVTEVRRRSEPLIHMLGQHVKKHWLTTKPPHLQVPRDSHRKRVLEAMDLLKEVRDCGLIYWVPQTARGVERKSDMMDRITKLLDRFERRET